MTGYLQAAPRSRATRRESRQRQGNQDVVPPLSRPSLMLTASEFPRWTLEAGWGTLLASVLPAPNVGNGRPVLVLPGFLAGDGLTAPLRHHLRNHGFYAHPWRLGRNYGLTDDILDGVLDRFDALHARHGEPISLVGWSFGGLLGRWLAHARPESARQVICLGSPWRPEGEQTRMTALFNLATDHYGASRRALEVVEAIRRPVPVPCTAIYSRSDGVLHWRSCTVEGAATENIAVPSSHAGLVCNPLALAVVTDRLAQDALTPRRFRWQHCVGRLLRDTQATKNANALPSVDAA